MKDKTFVVIFEVTVAMAVVLVIAAYLLGMPYLIQYSRPVGNTCECDSKPILDSIAALQERVEALEENQDKCQWMEKFERP